MKTRNKAIALIVALVATAVLTMPALAATVSLTLPPPAVNNDNQKGWATNGTDMNGTALTTALTPEQVKGAKYLVLELSKEPEGDVKFAWQSDGEWTWSETTLGNTEVNGKKITIELSKMKNAAKILAFETQWKCFVGYWDSNFDDLGVTKAYLDGVTTTGTSTENVKTGDNTGLKAAAVIVMFTACASVLAVRKVKAR